MTRRSLTLGMTLMLAGICLAGPRTGTPGAAPPRLTLSPCRIEHPAGLAGVAAECGTLRLPENPADPAGRLIDVHVARVPAISRRKQADPLFVIAGGPGMASTTFYAGTAPAFARIRRDRDIVLVDQRGTGQSNPLVCEADEDDLWRASDEFIAAETKRCLDSLASRADVRYYTTSVAVKDLEQVRLALGYGPINLYGVSYGTRVAQHYLRRFPSAVRSLILDGVVPPQLALGPALALDAEAALGRIFDRCRRDSSCKAAFGDPAAAYHDLRAQLEKTPVELSLPDPSSGKSRLLEFSMLHLATVLRLASYSSDQAALLPLSLDLAWRDHDFTALGTQFLLMSDSIEEQLAYGMHNSVVCTEDVPFYEPRRIDRSQLEKTYLGTTQLDGLTSTCRIWPRGPIDRDFHEPLRSDVPVLLMSGGADPVTPPSYAEQVRAGFPASRHLVLPDQGHGQLTAPCIDRVMSRFIEQGTAASLDVSCTKNVRPLPFFTSLAGPAP